MSSRQHATAKVPRISSICRICRSRGLQCDGIRPTCGPCQYGNKTCVWLEDGSGPRRGSFSALARPLNLARDKVLRRPARSRRSQIAEGLVAAGGQRDGGGRFLNLGGSDAVQHGQQREQAKQMAVRRISYKKLLDGDDGACAELLVACTSEGCFWLDLNSEVDLLNRVDWLLRMSQTLHDLPEEEKWRYEEERPDGYNNIRYNYRTLPNPNPLAETEPHLTETWSVDLPPHRSSPLQIPDFSAHKDSFDWPTPLQHGVGNTLLDTMSRIHDVGLNLLNMFVAAADQSNYEAAADAHDPNVQTRSGISLLRYPPALDKSRTAPNDLVQLRENTEIMTIIFASVPGLYVQDKDKYSRIPILDRSKTISLRYALVTVGDELNRLRKGRMKAGGKHVRDMNQLDGNGHHEICYQLHVAERILDNRKGRKESNIGGFIRVRTM